MNTQKVNANSKGPLLGKRNFETFNKDEGQQTCSAETQPSKKRRLDTDERQILKANPPLTNPMTETLLSSANPFTKYAQKLRQFDFNIYDCISGADFHSQSLNQTLFCLTKIVFKENNLLKLVVGLDEESFDNFLRDVFEGYFENHYHSAIHAVDVLVTEHYLMKDPFYENRLTIYCVFGAYLSAVCHDLGHEGLNNKWYDTVPECAMALYDEPSVLEQYHLSQIAVLMKKPKNRFLRLASNSVQKYIGKVLRNTILATDNAKHKSKLAELEVFIAKCKTKCRLVKDNKGEEQKAEEQLLVHRTKMCSFIKLKTPKYLQSIANDKLYFENKGRMRMTTEESKAADSAGDDRMMILELTLHLSDISNPFKSLKVSKKWGEAYLEETFDQGRKMKAKGIECPPMYNEKETSLASSQSGFIGYVVKPLLKVYRKLIATADKPWFELLENEKHWERVKETQK